MQFVFLGSHVCTPASFRQFLADLPLPSASPTSAVSNGVSSSFNELVGKLALHFGCAWRYAQALRQSQTEPIK